MTLEVTLDVMFDFGDVLPNAVHPAVTFLATYNTILVVIHSKTHTFEC